MDTYFNCHNHTMYSNLRLLDSINKPKDLIDTAIRLGLSGIAITDHEALCAHMEVNQYANEIYEQHPDFVIGLGNEIYLTENRDSGQTYYHFLLIAKDLIGHRALKELSSIAWYNMYVDRRMERVPTLKTELSEVINKYKGHVIATTACIGGELSSNIIKMCLARDAHDEKTATYYYNKIVEFIEYCKDLFEDDFYIECAPSNRDDQIMVNKMLYKIAQAFDIPLVVGTDSHYLTKEDRFVHEAYLNSKEEEREVASFYEFARLMTPTECRDLLNLSFGDDNVIDMIFENTISIQNKITRYSLEKHQSIPEVEVKDYPKFYDGNPEYPILKSLFESDNIQERYWINQCAEALEQKHLEGDSRYWERLEEEARVKRVIGEKLHTCMFAYPNTLQHYINLFWRCGSTVGAGRGSACSGLNHYLLGITQLDPIEWDLPFWRYLNDERVELGDIDLDLAPSKLPKIFEEIRKERGELGLIQVCTFGTEGTKSAVLTACRGYRGPGGEVREHINGDDTTSMLGGLDVDEAQYMSSLIPQERGFLWPLKDVVQGNLDKGRKPVTAFVNEVNKYPGLLDIMFGIEGMISHRGSHASGVILFDENIFDTAAIMRTPSGSLVTQWDLHMQEAAGSVKYDFLLTAVQDIIIKTVELLQKDNLIEPELSLREAYDKYLHPNVLPRDDKKMWDALAQGSVISCFQFDSQVGAQAAKKIKPTSPMEMADANGLMRLMASEKGAEMPLDKYVRFKNNISLWYKEMTDFGLTPEEQKTLEPYFLSSYGVPPSQEQLMKMLRDENICGFTLGEANNARKIVGKKQMSKIPALQQQVMERAKSERLGAYVWKYGAGPQMGYSFSIIHALAYSFVGMQTLYLATHFNPIYWNTACLIVNSGSLEDNSEEEIVDIYAPEGDDLANGTTFEDLPDKKSKVRKTASTDYAKIAKAIGAIQMANIKVSLVDINKSDFGFAPDVENNQILFGMKGILNVGDDLVKSIIQNRPYSSPRDFLQRVNPSRSAMIALIKSGAFDNMMERKMCMAWYIWETCDKKKRLTLQNMAGLSKYDLLPRDTKEQQLAFRAYEFNRYLKAINKGNKSKYYNLTDIALKFLEEIGGFESAVDYDNGICRLEVAPWERFYQGQMNIFREWIAENKDEVLQQLNEKIFKEDWIKYAIGTISAWEMEVLCFYYHDHELANVDNRLYNFANFFDLPREPEIDRCFFKGGKQINLFKLTKICGTCIAKNKTKSTVSLLTNDGVVEVKFRKEYFSLFDKQISERGEDGIKHVKEKSWFNRGSMIVVQGMRSEDMFIAKKYSSSAGHQLYKIDFINDDGTLILRNERYKGEAEDD